MKRTTLAIHLLALATLTACMPKMKLSPIEGETGIRSKIINEFMFGPLVSRMSDNDFERRQQAQRDFEKLCFAVGQPGCEQEREVLCQAICDRLGPRTAMPARVWMVRQLACIGGAESVATLATLLSAPDAQLRECARRALQENASESAGVALREALGRAHDPAWQVALINALAARRDEECVAQLADYLHPPGSDVARAAIIALGEIGTPKAAPWLNSLSREMSADQHPELTGARLRCADHLRQAGANIDAKAIYSDLLTAGPVQVRMAALEGIAALDGQKTLPALMQIVGDMDSEYELTARAIGLAAEMPGFAVTITLAARLQQAPPGTRVLLLRALAERGDTTALPAVLAARKDDSEQVRIAAYQALARLGERDAAVLLARAAAQAGGAERDAARQALARLSAEGADDALLDALRNAASELRVEIIHGLSARRCQVSIIVLLQEADGDDEAVAIAAFEALGELATRRHAVALTRLLTTRLTEDVRAAAEDAVVKMCLRFEDPNERAGVVLALYQKAGPSVHASMIRVLGRIRGLAALRLIRGERRGGQADVVDAATRALAKWPTAEVLDDLLEIARFSDNQTHRVLALGNYVRLLELPSERNPRQTLAAHLDALALTRRPEEQKLVLAGIANVRHIDALEAAQRYLRETALRDEAEAAVVTVAGRIGLAHPDEARGAIESVIAETTNQVTRERAERALETLRASLGCITTWMVAGPYFEDGKSWEFVFDRAFAPERSTAANEAWSPLATTNEDQPWVFDLTGQFSGDNRCVYARCAVWSEQSRLARIEVGSDDAVKVWLNGRLVHESKTMRGHQPLHDQASITLNAGWNDLLLKIVQIGGGWGFSCAVKDRDGQPLDGLRFAAEAPASR